jgi:hypothetical protein
VHARIGEVLHQLGFEFTFTDERFHILGGRAARTKFLNICNPIRRGKILQTILGQVEAEPDRVVSIEADGVGEVISMETETGNYVAWGYLSKNCTRYAFVRHKETGQLVLFIPNLAQRIVLSIWAMLEEKGLAITFLSVKARQLGISSLSEMAIAHRVQFQPNINSVVSSSDPEKSKLMAKMMEICWDNQPWWMVPEITARRAGQLIEFGKQNSAVSIQHGTQFSGISRGSTVNACHLSELVDYDNPRELIDASLMGAKHESKHLFMALESTAKGRDNWLHDAWRTAKERWPKTLLYPIFLAWFVSDEGDMYPSKTYLIRNPIPDDWEPKAGTLKMRDTAELYVRTYPPVRKFLGRDWKMRPEQMWWWENERDEAVKKRQLTRFMAETPSNDIEAFQSSNISAFDSELVAELRDRALATTPHVFAFTGDAVSERLYPDKRDVRGDLPEIPIQARWRRDVPAINFNLVPLKFESFQEDPNGRLYIWEFPKENNVYVIGADTAEGIGQDRSVLQVIRLRNQWDPHDLDRQVAEFASSFTNARDLWPLALALGTYYSTPDSKGKIEQIRQVIECNGGGESVQYELQKLGWWNFHPWKSYDNKKQTHYNKIGWFTNYRTRAMAVDTIVCALRDEWLVMNSPWFVEEMDSFERDETRQSLRAGWGSHDDRIMSVAFALFSSYVDEITTDGRSFFTSRKKPGEDVPAVTGVRPSDLTQQLLKELGQRSNDPYKSSGNYRPY